MNRNSIRTLSLTGFAAIVCLLAGCGSKPESVQITARSIDADTLVIQNVSVFDSETLRVEPGLDVTLEAGRISAIDRTGGELGGAHVVPGKGSTLVAGLIDMHGHVSSATGPSWQFSMPDIQANLNGYLYAGVTTVFDPSDPSGDDAFQRRDQIAASELIGPRIFTVGRMLTHPDGHPRALIQQIAPWWIRWYLTPKVADPVASPVDARKIVDERADAGADAIKIAIDGIPLDAPKLSADNTRAIVKQAHSRGLRTVAHIGTYDDAVRAAEAGVALWVHGVYKEPLTQEMVKKLASFNIPMVTTSEVFDRYGRAATGPIQATRLEKEIVPKSVLDSFFPMPDDFDIGNLASWIELMSETIAIRQANVHRLRQAGVTILAGSDVQSGVFPGASLHRELGNLVEAGMSPAEAIRAATWHPAQYLANGGEVDSGNIRTGFRADLILVDGDPTEDIDTLAKIREVIVNGAPINRTAVSNR